MVSYKNYTNVGNREVNEDSISAFKDENRYCFVLADGLGGHGKGECASELAVKTTINLFADNYSDDFLEESFEKTQENILKAQRDNVELADMKTTMVTLLIDDGSISWGHIGDSRLYRFSKNKLVSRTLDHSVPQMLVNMGELKEKDIRGHEDRNRLLRVLGAPWKSNSYEISDKYIVKKTEAFLLCSDGFWELIDEKQMVQTLKKSKNVDEWMEQMIDVVNENGKNVDMDNNSAIAVWVEV